MRPRLIGTFPYPVVPSGGAALQRCSSSKTPNNIFVCGLVNDNHPGNCSNSSSQFSLSFDSDIILRSSQVAELQASNAVAMNISPATIFTPYCANSNATSHKTTISSGRGYTAAEVAGAAVGVGVPLLLALVGALVVVFSQKKELREWQAGQPHPPAFEEHAGSSLGAYQDKRMVGLGQGAQMLDSGHLSEMDGLRDTYELQAKP
jgi:hypothetical protein